MADLLPVGKVSKLFGRKGEVMISLYDTFPDNFNREEPLMVEIDSLTVPLFFDRFEKRGNRKAVALFADFYTEKRVSELVGCELFGGRSEIGETGYELDDDEDDLLYLDELVGFDASLGNGIKGVIEDFIDSDNPLFLVRIGKKEIYVPAVDDMIEEIDVEARRVIFDLPEGLIELND